LLSELRTLLSLVEAEQKRQAEEIERLKHVLEIENEYYHKHCILIGQQRTEIALLKNEKEIMERAKVALNAEKE
jgi:hypothetical protein